VINVFQLNYETRLKSWYDLRQQLQNTEDATKCVEIDKWWQSAPIVNHYLHPDFTNEWPGPWELLVENNYCTLARGLGMCYTLLLLGVTDIDFVLAKDDTGDEVALVLVDRAKYILNYWPNMVLNINLQDFIITKRININELQNKLQ
jgi:hypothetical protein